MKINDSVKIKVGIQLPDDPNRLIEGWVGRVTEIENNLITIAFDSITLSEMPEDYILECVKKGFEFTEITLEKDELEPTEERDSEADVEAKKDELEEIYEFGEQSLRVYHILDNADMSQTAENFKRYYYYLKKHLTKPCILTGMEDFEWEEPYVLGGWDKKEYEQLKKTNPSYTDHFKLMRLVDDIDDWKGVMVRVRRLSDNKLFTLPLWDLEVVDEDSPNFPLVEDYTFWMTNYR